MHTIGRTPSLALQDSELERRDDFELEQARPPIITRVPIHHERSAVSTSSSIRQKLDQVVLGNSSSDLSVLPELKATIRKKLKSAGTAVRKNDKDRHGDGDQSPVQDPASQAILHEIFYTGE